MYVNVSYMLWIIIYILSRIISISNNVNIWLDAVLKYVHKIFIQKKKISYGMVW